MKTVPLVMANLKGFLRDWESIVLLIGFPLLIISLIFVSFSPDDIRLEVGMVNEASGFNTTQFAESADRFAEIKDYSDLSGCIADIEEYSTYVCVKILPLKPGGPYQMDVYYDNTKEIIGERIKKDIKDVAREMEVEYSEKKASQALERVERLTTRIQSLQERVNNTIGTLETRIDRTDRKIDEMRRLRSDLRNDLNRMDRETSNVREDMRELNESRAELYEKSKSRVDRAQRLVSFIDNSTENESQRVNELDTELGLIESDIEQRNQQVLESLESANRLLESYEEFDNRGRSYISRINDTIEDLKRSKALLKSYRRNLTVMHQELENMEQDYSAVLGKNPGEIVNSLAINNRPLYGGVKGNSRMDAGMIGAELLTLQTIYSTLLLLVSIFVSLMVSEYISLNQINSRSRKRLEVITGTFTADYISIYIASMAIIAVPIICVLGFGQFIFKLPIISSIGVVGVIMFLLCSSITNIGIGTAHLIRKSSITLLVGSFLLIFFIFFSGIVLPIEMMTPIPGAISQMLPGTMALKSFDMAVLYGQPLGDMKSEIGALLFWNLVLFGYGIGMKRYMHREF